MSNFNLDSILKTFPEFKELESNYIKQILPIRNETSSKHDFGHAQLIVGSLLKAGAAILATKACLRSGAGLTTVHIPNSCRIALNICCPEAMLSLDSLENFISEIPDLRYKTAIGIGPGIGFEKETIKVVESILQSDLPKVLDADALSILAQHPPLFQYLNRKTILTPHEREFDRLTKVHQSWEERIQTAQEFVKNYDCILVLKAPNTLIFSKENVFYNNTGNVGLAKGGSGDLLTGIITSYLAQGLIPFEAALAGVFNHGLAADLASKKICNRAMIASDILFTFKSIS
jgi:hydroxyethylthiazole kinase-like uncharacterized protein yjeF